MAFDTLKQRMGAGETLSPMQIAHNDLFSAREKLELLNELKAQSASADDRGTDIGFTAGETDEAIAEVRRSVQDGVGTQPVLSGDF